MHQKAGRNIQQRLWGKESFQEKQRRGKAIQQCMKIGRESKKINNRNIRSQQERTNIGVEA